MATFTDDVARLQSDVSNFAAFKAQVEAYIQENQNKPTVDTTALEAALSQLEANMTTASSEVSAAETPAAPAPQAPAQNEPESGSNAGTGTADNGATGETPAS